MKKSDLKNGMRIEYRNGGKAVVIVGSFKTAAYDVQSILFCMEGGFMSGSSYMESLESEYAGNDCYNIVKVYDSPSHTKPNSMLNPNVTGPLLWERPSKEKPILELDGVEYSETTLRSLIKKATS